MVEAFREFFQTFIFGYSKWSETSRNVVEKNVRCGMCVCVCVCVCISKIKKINHFKSGNGLSYRAKFQRDRGAIIAVSS